MQGHRAIPCSAPFRVPCIFIAENRDAVHRPTGRKMRLQFLRLGREIHTADEDRAHVLCCNRIARQESEAGKALPLDFLRSLAVSSSTSARLSCCVSSAYTPPATVAAAVPLSLPPSRSVYLSAWRGRNVVILPSSEPSAGAVSLFVSSSISFRRCFIVSSSCIIRRVSDSSVRLGGGDGGC